jgi:hypothetical protein
MSEEPGRQGHGCGYRLEHARGQGDDQTPDETIGDLGQLVCDCLEMPVRLERDSWPHDAKGNSINAIRSRASSACRTTSGLGSALIDAVIVSLFVGFVWCIVIEQLGQDRTNTTSARPRAFVVFVQPCIPSAIRRHPHPQDWTLLRLHVTRGP